MQKSNIFKAINTLIFACSIMAGLSACQAADNKNDPVATESVADEEPLCAAWRKVAGRNAIPLRSAVDSMVVFKSMRELKVYRKGRQVKTYVVSLGSAPVGRKEQEGDRKTPEGRYTINDKNANSIYHKNLGISYPNKQDRLRAQRNGVSAGSEVKLHGLPNDMKYKPEEYLNSDWTWGCIALSNEEIDELYRFVAVGTPIVIFP